MPDDLPAVSNSVEDASGQVAQVGVVHGDINLHAAVRPPSLPLRVGLVPLRAASFQERADVVGDGVTVLSGMGGVGKTQLAADHAERAWDAGDVQLLVWVTASSREAIMSGYADAAAKLTGQPASDPEQGARTLLEWLATTTKSWLVVLDDLQTPADLTRLWPPASRAGQVVVTTRRRDSALRGHQRHHVEVDVFEEDEALAYVKTVLADQPRLLDDAEGLVQDLGRLPVALAQAAAYMRDKHLSCAQYRVRFAERRLAHVVPDVDGLPDEHQTTVAATWFLSVELANRLAPEKLAGPLLELASVLDANGVPMSVFTAPAALEFLSKAAERDVDESDARDGLGCLHRLSLITLDLSSTSREVRVHALVQRATRETWSGEQAGSVVRTAGRAVYEVWPKVERDTVLAQTLRSNVDALSEVGHRELWQPDCHIVLLRAGRSRGEAGLVAEASNYFDSLREISTRLLGPDHQHTLIIRNNLASWRGRAGDAKVAVATFQELLTDQLRIHGPDHSETLITRGNLAFMKGQVGDHAGAVTAYQELLTDQLRVLGPDHPDTLIARSNIAFWTGRAGDHSGAAAAHQELLTDQLRILGPDHPDTLRNRNNIAFMKGQVGDHAGAVTAHQEILADRIRVLGPDHPDTLITRSNLAFWTGRAGDHSGAAAAHQELLTDQLRILGPDHPHTLRTRNNIAYLNGQEGDHAGAVTAHQEILTDRIRILGLDHPDTQITRSNLDYWKQRASEE